MKNLFALVVAAVLAVSAGCVSPKPNQPPLTDAQRIDRMSLVLKNTVSGVVTLAADDRKQATRDKIQKARTMINHLVAVSDADPESILGAIQPLLLDAKPEVRLAALTAVGILEAYWGDYVVGVPAGNENALKFLKAIVDGIDAGLALSPPVVQ